MNRKTIDTTPTSTKMNFDQVVQVKDVMTITVICFFYGNCLLFIVSCKLESIIDQ